MPAKTFSVVRDFAPAEALRGAAVAIGNFDGVHRGHKAVIMAALSRARSLGKPAAAHQDVVGGPDAEAANRE